MISRIFVVCSASLAILGGSFASAEVPRIPTYAKDVAPIMSAKCIVCHRPGDIGPMSLMTFDEVRPWAKSIAKYVADRQMPPWHADPAIGAFQNDRSLSQDEIDTIVQWAKRGAKRGDPSDIPPVPVFNEDGWRLGEPDLILEFDEVELPAGGPDLFYDLSANPDLSEDHWVNAVEVRPTNRKVAHHAILWMGQNQGGSGWLGAWAAGMDPMEFGDGVGRLLPAGDPIVADLHYHPTDEPSRDQLRVGLHFSEESDIEKELINLWVENSGFEIPAGRANYGARATYTFPQDAYVISMLPHMHYRGKDFNYTATFPDGRKEKLLQVSDYDFNWQTVYTLEEPLYVPKGTRIDCVAHWDNSAGNPANPDPTRNVRFGSESYDEMMIGFIDYVVKDGISPRPPEEILASYAQKLATQHPGEIYSVSVVQDDGAEIPGVLRAPRSAISGTWRININGSMFDTAVTELSWSENAFRGLAALLGQEFEITASVDPATGELTGRVEETSNANNTAPLEGHRVD